MFKKLTALSICVSSLVLGADRPQIIGSEHCIGLTDYLVTHNRRGFKVDGEKINPCYVDSSLHGLNTNQLFDLLHKRTKLQVVQQGDTFGIKRHDRLTSGGPWLGWILYTGTKSILYGIAGAVVNKAAKKVTDGISDRTSTHIPRPEMETMVTGFQHAGTLLPIAMQEPGAALVTNYIDNNAQIRPEAYNAVVDGATVATAGYIAQGGTLGSMSAVIETVALTVKAWGDVQPTP